MVKYRVKGVLFMRKNKSVLLLAVNSKYIHSALAPYCIAEGLLNYCDYPLDITVCEGTINEQTEVIAKKATDTKPDILGISVYIWNIEYVKRLLPLIRKTLPDTIIILGGPEVSYNPYVVLIDMEEADFVVGGEGEKPFARLVSSIIEGGEIKSDGVSYRKNNEIFYSEPFVDDGEFSSGVSGEYIKGLNGRISYMESQRGCPYSCSFCLSGRCGKLHYLPIDRVFADILSLSGSGSKTVKFVDRTFNSDKKRAKSIIDFITDNYGKRIPYGVCFHFEIAADILDDELLLAFSRAPQGAIQLEAGLQSFNPQTLSAISRRANLEKTEENIKKIISFQNIHVHLDLIAGLPKESIESFLLGFDRAYKLKPHKLQLGFLKLLHGSAMEDEYKEAIFSRLPPYEVLKTPYISEVELSKLHKMEDAFEKIYCSGRFRRTLDYVFATTKMLPSSLFMMLGNELDDTEKCSLFDYTAKVFKCFSVLSGINHEILRDMMAVDYISTNSSGNLPPCLKIYDNRLREAKKLVNRDYPEAKGVKRGIVAMCSENAAVFADYTDCNMVTCEYKTTKIPL